MQRPSHPDIILEDKLIILYALRSVKTGISRSRLSEIILENVQFNYFDLHLYIDQMIKDGLIDQISDSQGHQKLILSSDGRTASDQLSGKIPAYIRELLDLYIEKNRDRLLEIISISAEVVSNGPGNFQANCSVTENNICLMSLSVNVPTLTDAQDICKKWRNDPQKYYAATIKALSS